MNCAVVSRSVEQKGKRELISKPRWNQRTECPACSRAAHAWCPTRFIASHFLCFTCSPAIYVLPYRTCLVPYAFLCLKCFVPYVLSCLTFRTHSCTLVSCVFLCCYCLVLYVLFCTLSLTCFRCFKSSKHRCISYLPVFMSFGSCAFGGWVISIFYSLV